MKQKNLSPDEMRVWRSVERGFAKLEPIVQRMYDRHVQKQQIREQELRAQYNLLEFV